MKKRQALFRFGLAGYGRRVRWNPGWYYNVHDVTDFATSQMHNIEYPQNDLMANGKEVYLTISLDFNNSNNIDNIEYCSQAVYINGELLFEGNFNKERWKHFSNNELKTLKYFCVGRSSMTDEGYWHYSKLNSYALRLYSKGLSENEVKANYNATVAYHNILTNGGSSETGGETGGENLESVE